MSENRCCPPPGNETSCCPPSPADVCGSSGKNSEVSAAEPTDDRPGYKLWPFVCGWQDSPAGRIPQIATRLTIADIIGRWQMRWGFGRARYSIAPGLYAIGSPSGDSPVLVTANYKMTFDIVRRDMHGHDVWLLVLDTKGVNVWCAAGKGTFGTDEILNQVHRANLGEVVNHRTLIVPQLGAPGVAAHKVRKACGFKVVYGPVRSRDLPDFLNNSMKVTPAMRRVTFSLSERLILTPVELVSMWRHILWSVLALFILGGIGPQIFSFSAASIRGSAAVAAGLVGLLTGAVIVPLLLPWLPGRAFAKKGAAAGLAAGVFGALVFIDSLRWLNTLALIMTITAISSWCAMHFTGSSTFTSPSGVEKEMRKAIPGQAAALLIGGLCWLASAF
ncbi:MAG: mercury methylation corrinoid protein HgcA [Desulfuromonadales bacterium]|nr:mercury methylation corrinoid protein HgcA [Desulfuromonadales bacterium]